ncbi:MAG: hypothetical protein C0469_10840 [Cyanobacteria bacterium DS2.3.42]|nr:hypothetical protein [Cyanobacteria bacterium DS2.3.42]
MAIFGREEIIDALTKLGALSQSEGETIELILVGGGVMVLVFGERDSTRDLDVLIVTPTESRKVKELAKVIALERGWADDWLNDAAKGFLVGVSEGPIIFSAVGIVVRRPGFPQLLAMKLSAWRDELDISDARRILGELSGSREEIWQTVSPYLLPVREIKARYAFEDLWEAAHGEA